MVRTRDTIAKSVDKLVIRLAKLNVEFVLSQEELIEKLCHFKGESINHFKTQFKRIDIDYIHDKPVGICNVLYGGTRIWTVDEKKSKRKDIIIKSVDKWVTRLAERNLEFVLSPKDLIEQMCNFNGTFCDFKVQVKRTDVIHMHPNLVKISHVISGTVKVWTNDEKKAKQRSDNEKNNPGGSDKNGDTETVRFLTFFQLFPNLSKRFKVTQTVRGCLVDIILTSIHDSSISFGLQIATSEMFTTGQFTFNKIIGDILKYLEHSLFILLIGVVGEQIAGVYLIPPTPSVKEDFAKFKESMYVQPRMLSCKQSTSKLNTYLQTFRYISSDFQNGVKGLFKDLNEFSDDFLTLLGSNNDSVMNTVDYFSSLFTSDSGRTEWAGCKSFEVMNNEQELGLECTLIHGIRGDMKLKLDKYEIIDERKTLAVVHGIKSTTWGLCLRSRCRQGLNPLKVNTTTAYIRSDRAMPWPREPKDFSALMFLPVLTASGNLALRPNVPNAHSLHMNCNTNNHDEWIRVSIDKIGKDTYPENMTEIIPGSRYIKIRAIFYYDTLTKGSERLHDFLYLFRLFASRKPTQAAIDAYNNAITPELIEQERKKLGKKS